ncbi:AsnC family transcriptional regulator [Halovivax limisalsi]|uniref:AsnC family transcriptional regulator n=1 Tax=Halovivax limisalsi TaxID=1453760 RepID=UPI001FFDD9D7|nr:AsnC family transcriptional regulator [Halovivax limisalsi]
MQSLDETDLEILRLLGEDSRRPFAAIGEAVGLSGPAVSDRVSRLEEAGVINGFTVDVDRSQLQAGIPVFVRASPQSIDVATLRERVADDEAVEHLFLTAEGELWFSGRTQVGAAHEWLDRLFEGESVEYAVTLVDAVEWHPSLGATDFALTCAECGNTVDSEGESTRIDDEIYHFCCSSCRSRFSERYDRIEEGA